jgi:hypothetical protein
MHYDPRKIFHSLHLTSSRNTEYLIALIAYFIIARFIVGDILFSEGTIGFFHDWYIGPYPEMMNEYSAGGLYVWDPQTGNVPYSVDWIVRVLSLPFSFLGGEAYSKAIIVLAITLSGFTTFYLGRTLKLNPYISFLAGSVYIFSPVIFTRIVAGYMYYLIGFALAPAIVAAFLKGYDKESKIMFVVAGLLAALAVIQLQFLIMIFIVLFVFCINRYENIRTGFVGLSIVFCVCFFVTILPVVLAQIISPPETTTFNPAEIYGELEELPVASNLIESYRMLGYGIHPYSYLNLGSTLDYVNHDREIIPQWVFYANFVIPIAAFSALLLRRDRITLSLAVIALIGLFVVKGPNPPFPELFENFFPVGLFLFREVWHSMFLYGFAVTFLIALLFDKISSTKILRSNFLKYSVIISTAFLVIISNGYPLLLGNFAGYIQTYIFPPENRMLYNKYSFNDTFNTLMLPMFDALKYDDLKLAGIDPSITYSTNMIFPSNSAVGDIRHPTSDLSLWLISLMTHNKTDNLGSLLAAFGIKYVILRENFESRFLDFVPQGKDLGVREKWDSLELSSFLDQQDDLVLIEDLYNYKVYENVNNSTKVFIPKLAVGGLTSLDDLMHISNVVSLNDIAAYSSLSRDYPILLSESLQELNMDPNSFIPLGQYAKTEDPTSNWTSNLDAFAYHHVLSTRINNGIFATKADSKISFDLPTQPENSPIRLWAKVLEWNKGGEVSITVNGNKSTFSLFSDLDRFTIIPISEAKYDGSIDISITNEYGASYLEGFYIERIGTVQKEPSQPFNVSKIILNNFTHNNDFQSLIENPSFHAENNTHNVLSGYNDPRNSCGEVFVCLINTTDSWEDDSTSFQVSTESTDHNTWSWVYSNPLDVKPGERYEFVSHVKLNKYARTSHIGIEGYNFDSGTWQQLQQCPSGISGPSEWNQYVCHIVIPDDIMELRVALNAGFSAEAGYNAETLFDGLYLDLIGHDSNSSYQSKLQESVSDMLTYNKPNDTSQISEARKIDPTLWNVTLTSSSPFILAFAEPYDAAWKSIVLKDGKELGTINSQPLYNSINSFMIDHTGDLTILLKNVRQDWFNTGLIISITSVVVCFFVILVYPFYSRNRIIRQNGA